MSGLCDGRVVIVTGAGRGIGRSHALLLASEGAAVVVNDLGGSSGGEGNDATPAQQVVDEIAAKGGKAVANYDSVSSWKGAEAMVQQAVDAFGGLDVLINNAGIAGPTGPIESIDASGWERTIAVNLNSQYYFACRAVPLLKRSTASPCLIAMGSVAGRLGYAFRTPYASSKWAIVGLVKSLAIELGPQGVRVNAILPGSVEGERMRAVIAARAAAAGIDVDAMREQYLSRMSVRRVVADDDVAALALFLCSPAARNLSGQAVSVDGNLEYL